MPVGDFGEKLTAEFAETAEIKKVKYEILSSKYETNSKF